MGRGVTEEAKESVAIGSNGHHLSGMRSGMSGTRRRGRFITLRRRDPPGGPGAARVGERGRGAVGGWGLGAVCSLPLAEAAEHEAQRWRIPPAPLFLFLSRPCGR